MLLERATDINSKGQIVGIGYRLPVTPTGDDRVDAQHAFLLTPKCQAKDTTDTDGDGLPDCWEKYGVDTDGDGTIDVDLPKMGADPKHKDIFVELDHMTGHEISNDAINKVIAAFDAAPVDNPDGTQGIKLHVDNGPDSIMDPVVAGGTVSGKTWGSLSQADELGHIDLLGTTENGEYDWSAFRSLEQRYFSASRRPVFHYAISAHDFVASHASGISAGGYPSGAGEFLITLGGACPADPCTPKVGMQAGTFMHELGHNLGLGHGGGDHLNYKPNYLSIMNYRFQFSGLKVGGRAGLYDYSRFGPDEIAQIYEGKLHETFGLGTPGPILRDYTTTWNCRDGSIKSATVNAAMDWNCNGVYDSDEVSVNLNGDVDSAGQGIFSVLAPFDDWSHLVFTGGAIGKLGAGLPSEPQRTEADEAPMSVLLTFAHALDPANFPLADTTPPTVRCASADGAWHASDVGLGCTATDAGSGLANAGDASFSLSTHVAGGTETSDAQTESRSVCDVAGNCATAGPIGGNKVDKKAPEIAITLPVDGAVYQLGQNVNGVYSCTDGGAGLGGCVGPVASGAAIDTASVGSKTFAVEARDAVGNTARRSVAYAVAFRVCLLFDPTRPKNAGSTIPVKLQLCDARGANVSSASLPVTAMNVDAVPAVASGNANPANAFRFDSKLAGGGYMYNLSTKGLASGAHTLTFSAAGDPTLHRLDFLLG